MIIKRKNPCVPMVYYDKNTNMSDLTNLFVTFSSSFSTWRHRAEYLVSQFDYVDDSILPTWMWDSNVEWYFTGKLGKKDRREYSIYIDEHKKDYYQYKIIFQKRFTQIEINTYITGHSKLCNINDFYALTPISCKSRKRPKGMKNTYSSDRDKELDYYRMINEHICWFFSNFSGNFENKVR